MRKRVVLALLLVVAMVVTSGCSLVVKDAEVDAQTPIITVVGQTFTKGEVNALVQNSLNYQASLYSMYGMTFDPTSESAISSAQESVINGLIEQAVVDAKMDELGIELTEEDLAEIQTESESTYQGYKDTIKSAVYSDTELTGDELEAAIEETMTQYGYPTLDEIVEKSLRDAAIWDEVKDRLKKSALGMSGGQQQRLCIARALAVQPEVLLMDEPTSALDPISTSKIEDLAVELKKDYTIVMVTHNMQQATRISDKTAFFLLGEVVEFADTDKLFSMPADKRTEDYITGRFG